MTERTTCVVIGGGPAGMMLGLLLARAGVEVTVLEKHGDFLRDFRGDTVHPVDPATARRAGPRRAIRQASAEQAARARLPDRRAPQCGCGRLPPVDGVAPVHRDGAAVGPAQPARRGRGRGTFLHAADADRGDRADPRIGSGARGALPHGGRHDRRGTRRSDRGLRRPLVACAPPGRPAAQGAPHAARRLVVQAFPQPRRAGRRGRRDPAGRAAAARRSHASDAGEGPRPPAAADDRRPVAATTHAPRLRGADPQGTADGPAETRRGRHYSASRKRRSYWPTSSASGYGPNTRRTSPGAKLRVCPGSLSGPRATHRTGLPSRQPTPLRSTARRRHRGSPRCRTGCSRCRRCRSARRPRRAGSR